MASKDWNNMLSGRLYHAQDSELAAARLRARRLVFRYNQSAPENESLRRELARELFGQMGEGCYLEPPLRCDYGSNIRLGDRVYANFNLVVLDCAAVTIGNDVLIGPNVGIYTAGHPVDPGLRRSCGDCPGCAYWEKFRDRRGQRGDEGHPRQCSGRG